MKPLTLVEFTGIGGKHVKLTSIEANLLADDSLNGIYKKSGSQEFLY